MSAFLNNTNDRLFKISAVSLINQSVELKNVKDDKDKVELN
jgi:hypothetical protein